MVTVFGILNLTEDSFFDESRRLDPAGAVTAAIEMLRVGSDVVDVGPAASHPDARPVSPADEIRRIAPLLDALSDQMHRVSIDSFQPETQRYALKRGVGYLNDIQDFLTLRSIPILLRRTAGWWLCTQRSGMASPPAPVTFDPKTRSTRLCGSSRRGFPPCDGAGRCRPAHPRSGDGIFLEPRTGNIAARAVEPSKAEVGVGASAIGLGVAEILLGRHRWPSCKGSGSSEPCGGTSRDRQWR